MTTKYNPKHYTVEIVIGKMDVLSHDYGPEIGCAQRAVARLQAANIQDSGDVTVIRDIRVWHEGKSLDISAW